MVNFVGVPTVNAGVNSALFGGQPVRIWTPGVPLLSPRSQGNRAAGGRGGAEEAALPPPPPSSGITLPGCAPMNSCPANAWTAEAMNSGLSSPMARNVNAIMAAVNGTKNKRRVAFLNESAPSGKTNKNIASVPQQKGIQDRKMERRPVRNPYRKSETQARRKVFSAKASKTSKSGKVWNFPTKIDEFKKPEVEEIFNDFWKSVDEQEDIPVDMNDFWRRIEGQNRKPLPKENLAANFWKMVESQREKKLDDAAIVDHFLRMVKKSESAAFRVQPAKDLWKLIQHEESRPTPAANDAELMTGQFWKMVHKQTIKERIRRESMIEARFANEFFNMVKHREDLKEESMKFVVDSSGVIYTEAVAARKMRKGCNSECEATLVGDFFRMIDREQKHNDARVESFAGNFWKMINNSEDRPKDRRGKETLAGEFWKTVEFIENLKKKRETMRRLSASRREEAEFSVAPLFTAAATPATKNSASAEKEAARKAAMLFACSSLEPQQHQQHIVISDKPVGRQRTLSSSSSSLYSVREEEEEELRNSRRTYRVAPHYNAQQLGAAANNVSGAILVALRQKKKTAKPQQCHRQNMVAQERRKCVTRRDRIPSISNGINNDRKCGKRAW